MTVSEQKRIKLDARVVKCWFIGYSKREKAYRFEDIKSGRVLVSRDAQFMEDVFDGGRRGYNEAVIVDQNEEETTDQESSSDDETMKATAPSQEFEPGSKERSHWRKRWRLHGPSFRADFRR